MGTTDRLPAVPVDPRCHLCTQCQLALAQMPHMKHEVSLAMRVGHLELATAANQLAVIADLAAPSP